MFRILGPLSLTDKDRDITPTAPKVRQVLAFLLVRRNQVVQVSEFVDELWGENPPDSAMTTLQTYIYKLRKDVLDPSGLARLHTQSYGYLLDVADESVDVHHFERLAQQGRQERERGDAQRASALLTEALALWRAPALLGINAGEILSAHITRLEENKLRVLGMRLEADMQLGRYEELISELKELVRSHPLHERFHGNLMTALDRSGRRSEALEVYRRLREMLIDELGLEPSPALQRLHRSLLNSEQPENRPQRRPTTTTTERTSARSAVPAQLPPDVPDFIGRADQVERVRAVLTAGQDRRTAPAAVSICGMAGVGKTTLVLHVGHLERGRYPHGQLFADLRGSSRTPASPLDVLAGFLRALNVPEQHIPPTVEERSGLYRTWTNGRRLLVVLDDAADASQITPLVPASPESAVVVTSRWNLQVLPGVQATRLNVMTTEEAVAMLRAMIGPSRVDAEPEEAERIADRCGHLPLALRCVGARLAAASTWSLRKLVAMIESGPAALDHLRFGEFDVRANYAQTYYQLEPHDRSALRMLSLLPPPYFTAATAASLLGNDVDAVETQLSRLVAGNLLEARADQDVIQYQMHRLVRLYARERLHHEFIEPRIGSTA